MIIDRAIENAVKAGTSEDRRTSNTKVIRLLKAMAVTLKDLPHNQQLELDTIINDMSDGYKFNWLGATSYNASFIKG